MTSLVKGMVAGPQPHYEVLLTVPSVIGRLVDLIREHHSDLHRLSGAGQPAMHLIFPHGPTASPVGPAVLQITVTHPKRGNAPI